MKISTKSLLAIAGSALLLGACATPYDYGYGYGNGYDGYGGYAPVDPYFDPYPGTYYGGPTVGFGLGFSSSSGDWDHGRRHEWRGDRDRDHWRARDHDRH